MPRRHLAGIVLLAALCAFPRGGWHAQPFELSDQAFWKLSSDASEPGGYFRSQDITNLTSNELWFQHVIPELVRRSRPGAVYLGVGPEQNFTYMSALRPKMAIIFDIRRGNLDLQLLYKAMFELARDRAEFVAMLFSTPPLAGVTTRSSATQLFRALAAVSPTDAIHRKYLALLEQRLVNGHGYPLRSSDVSAIRQIYGTFRSSGVALRAYPTYADLMTATDQAGEARSFLASEDAFLFLKDLEARNLVVPVVGDFSGPKALRTVAAYLRPLGSAVGAFYLSNVEQYLFEDPSRASVGSWEAFCRNVAAMPLDEHSIFIRSINSGTFGRGAGFISSLGQITEEVRGCRGK